MIVRDGCTAVIGGLIAISWPPASQVPMRQPAAGGELCSGSSETTERHEIIVLLTPRIIYDQESAEGDQQACEYHRRQALCREDEPLQQTMDRAATSAWPSRLGAGRPGPPAVRRVGVHFDPLNRVAIDLRSDIWLNKRVGNHTSPCPSERPAAARRPGRSSLVVATWNTNRYSKRLSASPDGSGPAGRAKSSSGPRCYSHELHSPVAWTPLPAKPRAVLLIWLPWPAAPALRRSNRSTNGTYPSNAANATRRLSDSSRRPATRPNSGPNPVGTSATTKGCRERLDSILARNPQHLDARLLLAEVFSPNTVGRSDPLPRTSHPGARGRRSRSVHHGTVARRRRPDRSPMAYYRQAAAARARQRTLCRSPAEGVGWRPRANGEQSRSDQRQPPPAAVRTAAAPYRQLHLEHRPHRLCGFATPQDEPRPMYAILQPASIEADFGLPVPSPTQKATHIEDAGSARRAERSCRQHGK